MRFRLKTVFTTVLSSLVLAGSVASGASMADRSVPTATSGDLVTVASLDNSRAQRGNVVFANPREVVQSLPDDEADANSADALIAVPDGDSYSSLAALVRDTDTQSPVDEATKCVATAIYYEARSESLDGQLAVARVILNRARSSRFADNPCGVVKQPGQFSFVRGGVLPTPDSSRATWKTSVAVARIALSNAWTSKAEGALFFHARRAGVPGARQRVAVIDNHIFYR